MQAGSARKVQARHTPGSLLAYWLAAAAQGLLAIVMMLYTPSAAEAGSNQGISALRLIATAVILLPTILFLILAIFHITKRKKYTSWADAFLAALQQPGKYLMLLITNAGVLLAGAYLITATPEISEPFTQNLLERLLPLVIWITGLASQTILFLVIPQPNKLQSFFKQKFFLLSLLVFSFILLAWTWVVRTILPLESQVRGWNSQGVPLLEYQVLLAWGCGLLLFLILAAIEHPQQTRYVARRLKPGWLDLILGVLLWGAAVLLWQSIPIAPNWFVTQERPPNFEPYPNSDALYYDTSAQTALVGEGFIFFDSPFIRRPLHAAFLTLLHLLGGQEYDQVAFLQILFLAVYPVLGYLVTRAIHNRFSGLIAGVLLILREANSIAISGNITASHVKLLMVDIPTTVLVTGFVLAVLYWLKNLNRTQLAALFAGGVLGASILLRAETFIFFFPLSLVTFLLVKAKDKRRQWLGQSLLFLWGILLVVSPWIWRNWDLTGKIFFDSPISRFDLIAQRYQMYFGDEQAAPTPQPTSIDPMIGTAVPTESITPAPADLPAATRASTQPDKTGSTTPPSSLPSTPQPTPAADAGTFIRDVIQQTGEFIQAYPEQVARFIVAHFENSLVQTMLTLPASIRPLDSLVGFAGHRSLTTFWNECCGVQGYTRRLPFWHKWEGKVPAQSIIPVTVNLLFIAWGLQTAWRKKRWTGLTPALLGVTYLFLNALFRNSGGRYILPVDWITLVYFSTGLADITTRTLGKVFRIKQPLLLESLPAEEAENSGTAGDISEIAEPKPVLRQAAFYALTLGFLIFGSLMPFSERVFTARYDETRQNTMFAALLDSEITSQINQENIEKLLANGGMVTSGRALYPRFLRENLGEPGTNNPFGPKEYARIVFQLAGPNTTAIILPFQNKPAYLPHASDVLVIGCSLDEIFAVAVYQEDGSLRAYYPRAPRPLDLSCPFPAQDLGADQ